MEKQRGHLTENQRETLFKTRKYAHSHVMYMYSYLATHKHSVMGAIKTKQDYQQKSNQQ